MGNIGSNSVTDSQGRPMKANRPIRNRLTPTGADGRLVYRRTIRNIIYRKGQARWLYEDIEVDFCAVGYCKLPDVAGVALVALEVAGGAEVGWVRIDADSVEYTDAA
jgi:hypothetical protein